MTVRTLSSLDSVDAAAWDALVEDGSPFLGHAFLSLLEQTGCVGAHTGWNPAHLVLEDERGLRGAVPAYLKSHSWGEFVFDFGWAQAYARHGLRYYPKLSCAVPFTPASGPRLLARSGERDAVAPALIEAIEAEVQRRELSSAHVLFVDEHDRAAFEAAGWLLRRDCQFHWHNRDYGDFDAYLATFTAEKRKKAKRERRRVDESGIRFQTLHGDELDDGLCDLLHDLHRHTFVAHGHEPYLTREFFRAVAPRLGRRLMVKLALHEGRPVATALFFRSDSTLYGRYWGAIGDFHSLHFEACYHQGIEYCIEHGLVRFEPGTQGEHKVARGFEPTITWSAHHIADYRFRDALQEFIDREAPAVEAYAAEIDQHTPFRRP
ncbi:MAG: GNAT family N-acetyltransferase [Steroidobacteraceae bacterium]